MKTDYVTQSTAFDATILLGTTSWLACDGRHVDRGELRVILISANLIADLVLQRIPQTFRPDTEKAHADRYVCYETG